MQEEKWQKERLFPELDAENNLGVQCKEGVCDESLRTHQGFTRLTGFHNMIQHYWIFINKHLWDLGK